MKCGALSLTSDTRTISGMLRFLFDSRIVQETYRGAGGKWEGETVREIQKKMVAKNSSRRAKRSEFSDSVD